jgi:hypothetical protein
MKTLFATLVVALATFAGAAHAADATCEAKATEKKLAGAAKTSFMKKCEKDSMAGGAACEAKATEKKLAGAAKTSFVKKCEKDAMAPAADKPMAAKAASAAKPAAEAKPMAAASAPKK